MCDSKKDRDALLPLRTTVVLLAALLIAAAVTLLAYITIAQPAAAWTAGVPAFGAALAGLDRLIGT